MLNHKSELRRGKHYNSRLQRCYDKYGDDSFEFYPLFLGCSDVAFARKIESVLAAERGSLNLRSVDETHGLGQHSQEAKEKNRQSHLGKNTGKRSPETCKRISQALLGKKTGPRSEQFKQNLREYHTGRIRSDAHKEALRIANSDPAKHARIAATIKQTLALKRKLKENI
jgi:hypothetical protein